MLTAPHSIKVILIRVAAMAFGFVALSPAYGQAIPSDCGIISGAGVQWAGTNEVVINYGRARIDGVGNIEVTGQFVTTAGAGANAIWANGESQGSLTSYYIYYAPAGTTTVGSCSSCGSNICSGTTCHVYIPVVSSVPPFTEGYPSSNLSYTYNSVEYGPTQDAVFLTSYITDGDDNMIPFTKTGENVYLIFNTAHSPSWNSATPPLNFTNSSYGITGGAGVYPQIQYCDPTYDEVDNWSFPVPATATEMLISGTLSSTTNTATTMFIMNPNLLTVAGGNFYTPDTYFQLGESTAELFPKGQNIHRYAVSASDYGLVFVLDETQPVAGKVDAGYLFYVGYVEPIHHLSSQN